MNRLEKTFEIFKTTAILAASRGVSLASTFFLAKYSGQLLWGIFVGIRSIADLAVTISRGGGEQRLLVSYGKSTHLREEQRIASSVSLLYFGLVLLVVVPVLVVFGKKISILDTIFVLSAVYLHSIIQIDSQYEAAKESYSAIIAEGLWVNLVRIGVFFILINSSMPEVSLSLSYFIATLICVLLFSRHLLPRAMVFSMEEIKYTFQLGINYLLAGAWQRIDVIVVALMLGPPKAAVYSIFQSVSQLVGLIGQAHGRGSAPRVSTSMAAGNSVAAAKIISDSAQASAPILLMAAIVVSFLPKIAIVLVGFEAGERDLIAAKTLIIAATINSMFAYEGFLFSLSGRQLLETNVLLRTIIPLSLVLIVLANFFGILGVSVAVLLAAVVTPIYRRKVIADVLGKEEVIELKKSNKKCLISTALIAAMIFLTSFVRNT